MNARIWILLLIDTKAVEENIKDIRIELHPARTASSTKSGREHKNYDPDPCSACCRACSALSRIGARKNDQQLESSRPLGGKTHRLLALVLAMNIRNRPSTFPENKTDCSGDLKVLSSGPSALSAWINEGRSISMPKGKLTGATKTTAGASANEAPT